LLHVGSLHKSELNYNIEVILSLDYFGNDIIDGKDADAATPAIWEGYS